MNKKRLKNDYEGRTPFVVNKAIKRFSTRGTKATVWQDAYSKLSYLAILEALRTSDKISIYDSQIALKAVEKAEISETQILTLEKIVKSKIVQSTGIHTGFESLLEKLVDKKTKQSETKWAVG